MRKRSITESEDTDQPAHAAPVQLIIHQLEREAEQHVSKRARLAAQQGAGEGQQQREQLPAPQPAAASAPSHKHAGPSAPAATPQTHRSSSTMGDKSIQLPARLPTLAGLQGREADATEGTEGTAQRLLWRAAGTAHTSDGSSGVVADVSVVHAAMVASKAVSLMPSHVSTRDVLLLMQETLHTLGLQSTAAALQQEVGGLLRDAADGPTSADTVHQLREAVLSGTWNVALSLLSACPFKRTAPAVAAAAAAAAPPDALACQLLLYLQQAREMAAAIAHTVDTHTSTPLGGSAPASVPQLTLSRLVTVTMATTATAVLTALQASDNKDQHTQRGVPYQYETRESATGQDEEEQDEDDEFFCPPLPFPLSLLLLPLQAARKQGKQQLHPQPQTAATIPDPSSIKHPSTSSSAPGYTELSASECAYTGYPSLAAVCTAARDGSLLIQLLSNSSTSSHNINRDTQPLGDRIALLRCIQARLRAPPAVPLLRLPQLLAQAAALQTLACPLHLPPTAQPAGSTSLLSDRDCSIVKGSLPLRCAGVLRLSPPATATTTQAAFEGEAWFCRWSPNGAWLATATRGGSICIWSTAQLQEACMAATAATAGGGVPWLSLRPTAATTVTAALSQLAATASSSTMGDSDADGSNGTSTGRAAHMPSSQGVSVDSDVDDDDVEQQRGTSSGSGAAHTADGTSGTNTRPIYTNDHMSSNPITCLAWSSDSRYVGIGGARASAALLFRAPNLTVQPVRAVQPAQLQLAAALDCGDAYGVAGLLLLSSPEASACDVVVAGRSGGLKHFTLPQPSATHDASGGSSAHTHYASPAAAVNSWKTPAVTSLCLLHNDAASRKATVAALVADHTLLMLQVPLTGSSTATGSSSASSSAATASPLMLLQDVSSAGYRVAAVSACVPAHDATAVAVAPATRCMLSVHARGAHYVRSSRAPLSTATAAPGSGAVAAGGHTVGGRALPADAAAAVPYNSAGAGGDGMAAAAQALAQQQSVYQQEGAEQDYGIAANDDSDSEEEHQHRQQQRSAISRAGDTASPQPVAPLFADGSQSAALIEWDVAAAAPAPRGSGGPAVYTGHANSHSVLEPAAGPLTPATCEGAPAPWLACGSEDGGVYLWHRDSGSLAVVLRGHSGPVNDVAWCPLSSGPTAASSGSTASASSSATTAAALSLLLCSASDDCSVRFWCTAADSAPLTTE